MSADIAVAAGVVNSPAQPAASELPPPRVKPAPQPDTGKDRKTEQEQRPAEVTQKARKAASQLNNVMNEFDKGLKFKVHEATHRTYVEVIDKKTNKVLHTLPPKKLLDTLARFHEVIGMIFDAQG